MTPGPEFVTWARDWVGRQEVWPTQADLSGAATALVRLHHLYDLGYGPLLRGRFLNVTSPPMTSLELAYVTRAAVKLGYVCDAKELFSALETLSASEGAEKRAGSVHRLKEQMSNVCPFL